MKDAKERSERFDRRTFTIEDREREKRFRVVFLSPSALHGFVNPFSGVTLESLLQKKNAYSGYRWFLFPEEPIEHAAIITELILHRVG